MTVEERAQHGSRKECIAGRKNKKKQRTIAVHEGTQMEPKILAGNTRTNERHTGTHREGGGGGWSLVKIFSFRLSKLDDPWPFCLQNLNSWSKVLFG